METIELFHEALKDDLIRKGFVTPGDYIGAFEAEYRSSNTINHIRFYPKGSMFNEDMEKRLSNKTFFILDEPMRFLQVRYHEDRGEHYVYFANDKNQLHVLPLSSLSQGYQKLLAEEYKLTWRFDNRLLPWQQLSQQEKQSVKKELEEHEKQIASFILRDDNYTPVKDQEYFQHYPVKEMISEDVMLAIQIRHNDKLLFRSKEELEEVASRVFGKQVTADDILCKRADKLFKKATGFSVNQILAMFASKHIQVNFEEIALRDYLDRTLKNIYDYDILEIELINEQVEKSLEHCPEISSKMKFQIDYLKSKLNDARQETLKWARRGFRDRSKVSITVDKILGRKPKRDCFRKPDKALFQTPEGKAYLKSIRLALKSRQRDHNLKHTVALYQLMLIKALKDNKLLLDEQKGIDGLINEVQKFGKERDSRLKSQRNKPKEGEWMRLSELRLDNIQDGEVRLVPSMSRSLIRAAEQITDKITDKANPNSINPPGKNEIQDQRRTELVKRNRNQFDRVAPSLIEGKGKSRGAGIKRSKE